MNKNYCAYEDEGRDNLHAIDDDTPTEEIVMALQNACGSMNHEDENYIPAFRQAIKRLKGRVNV